MTNWEKFIEVFNVIEGITPCYDACEMVDCVTQCDKCVFNTRDMWWNEEYKEREE